MWVEEYSTRKCSRKFTRNCSSRNGGNKTRKTGNKIESRLEATGLSKFNLLLTHSVNLFIHQQQLDQI
jgi:hypothetical protein